MFNELAQEEAKKIVPSYNDSITHEGASLAVSALLPNICCANIYSWLDFMTRFLFDKIVWQLTWLSCWCLMATLVEMCDTDDSFLPSGTTTAFGMFKTGNYQLPKYALRGQALVLQSKSILGFKGSKIRNSRRKHVKDVKSYVYIGELVFLNASWSEKEIHTCMYGLKQSRGLAC